MSRTAVWKHIKQIRESGIEVEASSGRGYRLKADAPQIYNLQKIREGLSAPAQELASSIVIERSVDSTNDVCLNICSQSPENYMSETASAVVLAEEQTAGRGRRANKWLSPFGSNVYLSLSQYFEQGSASISGLSLVVGLAVAQAIKNMGGNNIVLKWPNRYPFPGKKTWWHIIGVKW